jgi:hypothetical protein
MKFLCFKNLSNLHNLIVIIGKILVTLIALNKREKGPLRDCETGFCSLMVLKGKKVSLLGVIVSEQKMFKEKLLPDTYNYEMP